MSLWLTAATTIVGATGGREQKGWSDIPSTQQRQQVRSKPVCNTSIAASDIEESRGVSVLSSSFWLLEYALFSF